MYLARSKTPLYVCFLFFFQQWAAQAQQPPEPAKQAPAQSQQTSEKAPTQTSKAAAQAKNVPADDFDGGTASFAAFYWYNPTHPHIRTGRGAIAGTNPSTLDFPGKSQPSPGAIVNIPAGKYNTLRIAYFQTLGHQAGTTPTEDLNFFGTDYTKGYPIDAGYSIKNIEASWDYLSWPFPVPGSTFRLKTLWGMDAAAVHGLVNGPYEVDSSGNSSPVSSEKTHWVVYPAFGVAIEKLFTKTIRWEARGSGFAWPHHSAIANAETTINFRMKAWELIVGGRIFYLKTSPNAPEYVYATLPGAFVGLRWYYPK